MKFSGKILSLCAALLLLLNSASALKVLNTISDLKKLNFGPSVPKHSLLLLHWFANEVDIDNNNVIRLTFDPDEGDFGSHHYGNYERMLDPLPHGNIRYRYFTVGNLNQETSSDLPSYVVHPRIEYEGRNRDRIIFRVREQNVRQRARDVIDRVYITQHFETSDNQGTRYDPDHTYQVTSNLLRQISQFSVEDDDLSTLTNLRDQFRSNADYSQLREIRNMWGDLACLGLFLFIIIQEKYSTNQDHNRRQSSVRRNTQPDYVVRIPESRPSRNSQVSIRIPQHHSDDITLQVVTGSEGKAKIIWKNVPVKNYKGGLMVALYRSDEDNKAVTHKSVGNSKSGTYNTSVLMNEGLQVRLHEVTKFCCLWSRLGEEIHRGPEFKNPTAPVSIEGYNASLELFSKDGRACVRLYVKTTFSDWMTEFKDSWVGFYTSADKATKNYEWWQWEWVRKFKMNSKYGCPDMVVYEYSSSMAIAPGVQARFILNKYAEKARTPCWK